MVPSNKNDIHKVNGISGATVTGASDGFSASGNDVSGTMLSESGVITTISFTSGTSEFCIESASAEVDGYDAVNLTIGGCVTVLNPEEGGVVESESAGIDIPAGALTESESIGVGEVTEELPDEVNNSTGYDVEDPVAFTPYDLELEDPADIVIDVGDGVSNGSNSNSRDHQYLCQLDNSDDTTWEVVIDANTGEPVSCSDVSCEASITEFGIFAACTLVDDCAGD